MLPDTHLTSHSRTCGSRWVTTPLWLSESLRPFLYSCHLFFISYTSVRSWLFLSFIVPIFAWNVPLVSPISLNWSLVFTILFFPLFFYCFPLFLGIVHLKKAFLLLHAILCNSIFSFPYPSLSPMPFTFLLFSSICKAFSDHHFAFLHFFYLGVVLVTASYTMLWTSSHRFLGILSTRSNPLNLFVTSTI